MTRKKTPRKRTRRANKRADSSGLLRYLLVRVLIVGLCALLFYVAWLDYRIRDRFDGNLHVQPAQLFSRSLSLSVGQALGSKNLKLQLHKRGYRNTRAIKQPGDFAQAGEQFDIFVRAQAGSTSATPAQAIRLVLDNHQVKSLTAHNNGQAVTRLVLEPELIGSMQLGSYQDRIELKLHQAPERLIKSLLAMEDRSFATHYGINPLAILRALWVNLRKGQAVQGGSTITQQLVKNVFLSPQRTLSRKATEALMAVLIELRYDKSRILELYVNEIFLGQSGNRAIHGFGLASDFYFGRPVGELELQESALLVGIIAAPSFYNPRRHPERALERRNLVLRTMAEQSLITEYTAALLSKLPIGIIAQKPDKSSDFPAFLDYALRQLRQYYSEETLREDGLKLYTTLDTSVQKHSQRALSQTLTALEQEKGFTTGSLQGAALVVELSSGDILALVGDRKPGYSGFNRAVDALRPIGSLVKPAVYLTALEQPRYYSLASPLLDLPLNLVQPGQPDWTPSNYDNEYSGTTAALDALVHSLNVPTVRLGLDIGVDRVIKTLHRLGIKREIQPFPSTLLGANAHSPLEIAQMYQTLGNHGVRVPLRSLSEIRNQHNKPLARFRLTPEQVIDDAPAFLIDYALKQVVRRGTAAALNRTFAADTNLAGKTGTTDDYRDSWFAGYSGNLVAVVWVGRDDNKPIKLTGSRGAMRVWGNIMQALDLKPASEGRRKAVSFTEVNPETGLLTNHRCRNRVTLPFARGYEPEDFDACAGVLSGMKSWFKLRPFSSGEAPQHESGNR